MSKQPEVSVTDKKNPSEVAAPYPFSPDGMALYQKALDERAKLAQECSSLRQDISKLQERLASREMQERMAQPIQKMQTSQLQSSDPRALVLPNGVRLVLQHVATYKLDDAGYAVKFFSSDGTELAEWVPARLPLDPTGTPSAARTQVPAETVMEGLDYLFAAN